MTIERDMRLGANRIQRAIAKINSAWRGRDGMVANTARGAMASAALAIAASAVGTAHAEPPTNRILSSHQTTTKDGCVLLKISFNIRIRYVSHFPLDRGDELRISIRPIDPAQATADVATRRESIRPPDSRSAPIRAIDFEAARADGPTLTIQFLRPVAYQVGPGADFESIVIAIADARSGRACKPEYPIGASGNWNTTVVRDPVGPGRDTAKAAEVATPAILPTRPRERAPGQIAAVDLRAAAAAMDEARVAIRKSDHALAARLLTKVLRYPENPHSAEAQELLGVVYQKNKQLAEARAEYEDYLRRYPNTDGTESVRQRLAAIETAQMPREQKLRAAKQSEGGGERGPGQTTWSVSGSASQFYIRDDSFRVVRDPSLPRVLNSDKEDHRVHRNSVLSSLDLFGAWGNDQYKSKFRFSGTEEHLFGEDSREIVGVSALYYEMMVREWGTIGRFGRQTRNTGGVLGRFDGGLFSWQATPGMRWNVVGGSPVASRRDEPFKDEKVFYGASVDFLSLFGGLDVSLFAVQQQVGGLIDRQAIGTELRYLDTTKSAFLTLDYDTHFQDFNAAIFSGSWTLADKSTLHGGVDYRKSPYLTSWNALQGQQSLTLFQLLKLRSQSEIAQMAVDRTTTYSSANVGYSRPLTDKLQLNLDATAAQIDGTIASFGVDALPSTGNEFYYSAQLIASSLFRDGDTFTAGVRFADRQDSNMYVFDFGTRFPLTPGWRINPRVLMSYREGKTTDLTEYSVLPTVLMDYYFGKDLAFEFEVGAKRTWREQAGVKDNDTELFFTLGYRYDFYADGKGRCPISSTTCR
ncbi:MAG: tetratricopeptide repeat protein [Hyphomicrobiaceae bacterium]